MAHADPRAVDDRAGSTGSGGLDTVTSSVATGTYVDPKTAKTAKTAVGDWCGS
jgi:hypothetical protein